MSRLRFPAGLIGRVTAPFLASAALATTLATVLLLTVFSDSSTASAVVVGLAAVVGLAVGSLVTLREGWRGRHARLGFFFRVWPLPTGSQLLTLYEPASSSSTLSDAAASVETAVRSAPFAVLVGEAGSGTTQAALAAIASVYPDNKVLLPVADRFLTDVLDALPERDLHPRPAILFLDDLDRFIEDGGRLDTEALASLASRPRELVVVATLRLAALADLANRENEMAHTLAAVLGNAAIVRLPDALAPPETQREEIDEAARRAMIGSSALGQAANQLDAGLAAFDEGDSIKAEAALRIASTSSEPSIAGAAQLSLGLMFARVGRSKEARQAFEAGLASNEKGIADAAALELGKLAWYVGDLQSAEAGFRRALEAENPSVRSAAALNLGAVFEHLGDIAAADQAYRSAATSTDVRPRALVNLGILLERAGRNDEAEAALREAVETQDVAVRAAGLIALARLLMSSARDQEAEQVLRMAAESETAYYAAVAASELGGFFVDRGRLAEAESAFRSAATSGVETIASAATAMLGAVLDEEGRVSEAIDALEQAANSDYPETATFAALHLGRLCNRIGWYAEAEERFKQATRSPRSDIAEAASKELEQLRRDTSLSGEARDVLALLSERGTLSLLELASGARLAPSQARSVLDALVERGLVERRGGQQRDERFALDAEQLARQVL